MVVNELVDSIFPEKPACHHGKTNNKNQQITIKTRVILFLNKSCHLEYRFYERCLGTLYISTPITKTRNMEITPRAGKTYCIPNPCST